MRGRRTSRHRSDRRAGARLQALAQPGEIYVSGSVREQIGEKLRVGFVDMGEHNVKNIARPIHVYRIEKRGEAAAVVTAKVEQQLALPDRPSIAVLPFRNMSGDPDQDRKSTRLNS